MSKIERMVTNFAVISAAPHSQPNPTPSLCCALSEPAGGRGGVIGLGGRLQVFINPNHLTCGYSIVLNLEARALFVV